MAREITEHEREIAAEMLARARAAMAEIADYDQAQVDRLAQAIGWSLSNETTFTRLGQMGVDESGSGDRVGRPAKRFKVHGILRDALRTPSVGLIETDDERGLVKYAKPAGVIASIVPMTNPALTPVGTAINVIKAKDAVIFSPHPRTKRTTGEVTRILREVMVREGVPADVFQCVAEPSIPLSQELMAICDMTLATGGAAMVQAAYRSGRPAFGVGAGNSTMVIDATADIVDAARNTRLSKTSDFGSGCSADGNLLIDASIYGSFVAQLVDEGGYLADEEQKRLLEAVMWDGTGSRTIETVAQPAPKLAAAAGFEIPGDRQFIIVEQDAIGRQHRFSGEKLTTLLAVYRCADWADTLDRVRRIYEVGGKGHSCGIYSFDDAHIDELARVAPVSRMMVRQPQSKANAGSFTNGMPMTSSLGCGIWGGNVTNENISLKHFLNVTWVSRPIPEDRPTEQELFGEFYGTARAMISRREFSLAYLSVAGLSPCEMIDVAAATGYDYVSLRVTKVTVDEVVPPLLTDPALVRQTRDHANDVGIGILDVELARVGPNDDAASYAGMMECAGALGARFALAQIPDHDRKRAIDSFATLCDIAAPHGIVVGLEFLPWGPTDDLAAAVEIVMGAAQPNGGIVIDTLHFCRSNSTVDQIRVLPSSLFPYVQLCDAPRYTPFTDDGLIHTAREARYFPGEAGLELRPLVRALPRVPYALEIPNDRMRADLGTEEFARRALEVTRRFLAHSEEIQEI